MSRRAPSTATSRADTSNASWRWYERAGGRNGRAARGGTERRPAGGALDDAAGSGRASPSDLLACEQWRSSKAEHEHAWQRAQRVSQRFGLVPATLGMAALNRPASPRRRAVLKTLALASATGPLAWAAWRADPLDWTADYRSAAGELREVALSDGSRLYLNTASAVDVAFSAASRLLRLRAGEIALHVRDESGAQARPFVVRTRYGDIEARAGRYCVRQEDGFCRVSV